MNQAITEIDVKFHLRKLVFVLECGHISVSDFSVDQRMDMFALGNWIPCVLCDQEDGCEDL